MKSKKALLSLLVVYPGNIYNLVTSIGVGVLWGWKGLIAFYILCVLFVVTSLFLKEDARRVWILKKGLAKDDWIVKKFCELGYHTWRNIVEEEPRSEEAKRFLITYAGLMRVGSGSCEHCGKEVRLVSFSKSHQPYVGGPIFTGPVLWDSWREMSDNFYKMYQETQESAE